MSTPSGRLVPDAQTLARITRLELRSRTVVEGVITGLHRSPHRGSSVEFAQHRDYVPGDEIRHIDWKVYARSDRYHIKQFEEETNLKATLAVDCSRSMDYRGESGGLSKREYASVAAAALATLLLQQRDAVGLATFDAGVDQFIPPASTTSHLRLLLEVLARTESRPRTNIGETFHDLAERIRRRGLVIVFSDLFSDVSQVLRGLQHFRHRRHEVILFHVLDQDELDFPFREFAQFEGMEGELPITAEPNALRREYLATFGEYIENLRKGCRELGMDYVQLSTATPVDTALSKYLSQRMAQAAR